MREEGLFEKYKMARKRQYRKRKCHIDWAVRTEASKTVFFVSVGSEVKTQ